MKHILQLGNATETLILKKKKKKTDEKWEGNGEAPSEESVILASRLKETGVQ